MDSIVENLVTLGLNRLEARVYVCLLTAGPLTGYRVAQKLGAAAPNVYKAIESLTAMGAILTEDGGSRNCRAVPADEFLEHLEWSFQQRRRKAAEGLAKVSADAADEGWYKLESVPQMLQRARDMLASRAERVAVVDAFPGVLAELLPSIRAAMERGVEVRVQAYAPVEIPGAIVVIPGMASASLGHWKSEQLNLVIDGRECIAALVDRELSRVYQGIWSRSIYLSCILLAGLKSEHTIHRLRECVGKKSELQRMKQVLASHSFFVDSGVPGQVELVRRFIAGEGEAK